MIFLSEVEQLKIIGIYKRINDICVSSDEIYIIIKSLSTKELIFLIDYANNLEEYKVLLIIDLILDKKNKERIVTILSELYWDTSQNQIVERKYSHEDMILLDLYSDYIDSFLEINDKIKSYIQTIKNLIKVSDNNEMNNYLLYVELYDKLDKIKKR